MYCPEKYIRGNGLQRRDAEDISNRFIEKMIWKPNEIVLDVGCGPGDVSSNILYPLLKNKIKRMVGVDRSIQMVEHAKKTYGYPKLEFKVLDIENVNECISYTNSFDKIFSFFCFHWIHKKADALINMKTMLKSGGEILLHFMLVNPIVELYKYIDAEWQIFVKDTRQPNNSYSQDEVKTMFIEAGFRIINSESSVRKYTYPDLTSILDAIKSVDDMYNVLPPQLHDRYSMHIKDKILEKKMFNICPNTKVITSLNWRIMIIFSN
ncbi:juvenile hormone acid O-methyltransferase isoform X2 [Sipha flava]|uniref:Juvenile hormone acid O-methyltransferase isoform X2 n=1 Tax=Sipha flava TaxID=143950 RepID=A0A8B8GEH9_9HEMI|nr:juvenile hormone acid O-methyltransferase isoform X2 [Sipha flava]